MSERLFKTDVLFLQRILSVSGFYDGPLNGKFTAATDAAEDKFFDQYEKTKKKLGEFDLRTESCIQMMIPEAQTKARTS
jgi:peptidoglycan L-alanyl-D-glutamate endopeptidase CwlK